MEGHEGNIHGTWREHVGTGMKHERTMIKTYTHQLNFVDVDVVGVVVSKNLQIRKNNFKNQYKQNVKHPSQILQTIFNNPPKSFNIR